MHTTSRDVVSVKHRATFAAILVALATACATETYKEPAAGSYTAAIYQVRIGDSVVPLQGAAVTREFFTSAGVLAFLGRVTIDADHALASVPVAVLSHALWQERMGGGPEVIGRTLEIDGRPTTIIGVAPPGFAFPDGARLWIPKR